MVAAGLIRRMTMMAEPNGHPGFTPPRAQQTLSRRRQATAIELIATVTLTVSLIVAAVSMGKRSLARDELAERGPIQLPLRQ
jgi:hypothetical protein